MAMLVRGEDRYGHFDLVPPPKEGVDSPEAIRQEAERRVIKNTIPDTKAKN